MPTFELEESDFAGYIEDGRIMPLSVVSVKVVEKPYTDDETGQKVKKVEFKFAVIDPDGPFDGQNVWGETGTKFNTHPDCKLRNWSSAILGTELAAGYRLDTDVLVGNECRGSIELYEYDDKKGAKDPVTDEYPKKQRNRVTDLLPSVAAMAGMAASGGSGSAEEPF